jgi:hypothetical protein
MVAVNTEKPVIPIGCIVPYKNIMFYAATITGRRKVAGKNIGKRKAVIAPLEYPVFGH